MEKKAPFMITQVRPEDAAALLDVKPQTLPI